MTVSALQIPEPLPDDPDAVTTALETAAIFGTQGDAREAVRWLRRAAELAGDEGNDVRALTLARVAADLTTQIGGESTVVPANATTRDAVPARVVAESIGAVVPATPAALDAALGLAPSLDGVAPALRGVEASGGSELGLAPTVSAQPPLAPSPPPPPPAPAAQAPFTVDGEPTLGETASPTLEASGAATGWIPPVPPPPPLSAEPPVAAPPLVAAPETAAAETAAVPSPSQGPIGPSQPPAQSLREALQRFSQHVSQNAASPANATSQPPQPDPQQSPALAALVQSIVQQTPRAPVSPGLGVAATTTNNAAPAAATPGIARPQPQPNPGRPGASAADVRAALADTAPNFRVPEPEVERTQPGLSDAQPASSSDPFSDAITDPRTVPTVEAKTETAGAPSSRRTPVLAAVPPVPPPQPILAATAAKKKAATGGRQAVRVSIAATTEEGVYLVELLKDGTAPAAGSHEAFVVLADPTSDVFEE